MDKRSSQKMKKFYYSSPFQMGFIDLVEACETNQVDDFLENLETTVITPEKLKVIYIAAKSNPIIDQKIITRLLELGADPTWVPVNHVNNIIKFGYEFVPDPSPYVRQISTGNEYTFEDSPRPPHDPR